MIESNQLLSTENNFTKGIDKQNTNAIHSYAMAIKAKKKPEQINFRPKDDDYRIIEAGMRKHGLDAAQIIRMGLRRFAEAEKLELRVS